MNINSYKAHIAGRIIYYLGFLIIFIAVLFFVLTGISEARISSDAEKVRFAEDSIRRAIISAYAIEGKYPSDFEHIQRYYGVHIDERRFIVHYRIFSPTIMPYFAVLQAER